MILLYLKMKLKKHKIRLIDKLKTKFYDGIIIAVNHKFLKIKRYTFLKKVRRKNHLFMM